MTVVGSSLIDLRGEAFDATPDSVTPGQSLSLAFTISNLGQGTATGFDVGFYLSTDAIINPSVDKLLGYVTNPVTLNGSQTYSGVRR